MASIGTYPGKDGRKFHRLSFTHPAGRLRKTIWLGRMSRRDVESVKVRVEAIVNSIISGYPPDDETARWLSKLSRPLAAKLARVKLIEQRSVQATAPELLAAFLDGYITKRIPDTKRATRTVYTRTRTHLVNYFGATRSLKSITTGDAVDFRRYLISLKRVPKGKKVKDESALPNSLSENTVRRTCGFARQFFRDAVDRKLIDGNPFESKLIPVSVRGNAKRSHFITAADAKKVLDACPDAQTRLVFALARYGGLRTPSETLALSWSDIDWTAGKMTVHAPKTEHHEGKESRVVPIFPELRPYLRESFDPDGGNVITIGHDKKNFRTRFTRIVKRAGLTPWPKLFHNLRASRQTELENTFPSFVVCAWLGNSQQVAREFYLNPNDEHFTRAIEGPQAGGRVGVAAAGG